MIGVAAAAFVTDLGEVVAEDRVALDESLVLQPLQKLLNGSMLRLGRAGLELLSDVAGRQADLIPEPLHDHQFGVSQRWLFQSGDPPLLKCTTTCRYGTTRCRDRQRGRRFFPQGVYENLLPSPPRGAGV